MNAQKQWTVSPSPSSSLFCVLSSRVPMGKQRSIHSNYEATEREKRSRRTFFFVFFFLFIFFSFFSYARHFDSLTSFSSHWSHMNKRMTTRQTRPLITIHIHTTWLVIQLYVFVFSREKLSFFFYFQSLLRLFLLDFSCDNIRNIWRIRVAKSLNILLID